MSPSEDVSSWLPRERERLGLTQHGLGELLDVEAKTIAQWELGERRMCHPGMLRLAMEELARSRRRPGRNPDAGRSR